MSWNPWKADLAVGNDITVTSSDGANKLYFEDCTFTYEDRFVTTKDNVHYVWKGCTWVSTADGDYFVGGRGGTSHQFYNCEWQQTGSRTALLDWEDNDPGYVYMIGCKIAGYTRLTDQDKNINSYEINLHHCEIPSGFDLDQSTSGQWRITATYCTDGTISKPPLPLTARYNYYGGITSTLDTYLNSSTIGATDGEQLNPHSWKFVTNANAVENYNALEAPDLWVWVDSGLQTLTVYLGSDDSGLQNNDFWIELYGPSNAGSATAQNYYYTSRVTPPTAATNLTTDTNTWVAVGSEVDNLYKISHTYTPSIPGMLRIRCFAAKPSTTIYLNPFIEVT